MATIAKTIREARDHLLKRINMLGVSTWEAVALELLNDSQTVISSAHDWYFLHNIGTLTFSDATGIVNLPSDCDRVMSLHKDGSDYMVKLLDPQSFVSITEDDNVTEPIFYTVRQSYQSATTSSPVIKVEFYSRPSSGSSYEIRYIRYLDEFLSTNLDIVPNIPPHIWDLICRHATLEALKMEKAPNNIIQYESGHIATYLNLYKAREKYGQTRQNEIRQRGDVSVHYQTRFTT